MDLCAAASSNAIVLVISFRPCLRSLQRNADLASSWSPEFGARRRQPLPASCLAALRSRSLLLFLSFLLVFLLGGALRSRFSSAAYATAAGTTGQTPPDSRPAVSARAEDADDLASPRPRVRSSPLPIYGGVDDAPGQEKSPDAIDLARFTVAEHNSKTNAALEFVRLVKVRTQVVAGLMYYFTVEVREVDGGGAGAYKLYEAKVWLREWENLKGLHSFEPVADAD